MRGPVGHDVAQFVCERLWRELKNGKHRDGRWPFRVIVHKVIGFTCAGWYEKGWGELELIEIDGPSGDDFTGDVELQLTLEEFVATLPPADGEVARLWLLERLEPDQIAERLGKEPNAVYQARFRIIAAAEGVAGVVRRRPSNCSTSSSAAGRAASRSRWTSCSSAPARSPTSWRR